MGVFTRRPPARRPARMTDPNIVASAQVLKDGQSAALPKRNGATNEMWGYFDNIPRLHYAVDFKARCFSRVRLRPGWRNDEDEVVPITEKLIEEHPELKALVPVASQLLRTLRARKGGQARLMFRLGEILSVAAECWLVPTDVLDEKQVDAVTGKATIVDRSWEVLSTDELRRGGRYGWQRHPGPGFTPIDLPEGTNPIRLWREHPRYSGLANSQVRPLLDTLEVLALSIRGERSAILSRLVGPGILLVDEELDFPDDPALPQTESGDQFAVKLTTTMSTPIGDRSSPSAWSPIVLRADLSNGRKVMERVEFGEPHETASIAKRTEMEERIAGGVDLPTESVTGHAQTTFHNAEQISQDLYNQHLKPDINDVAEDLTAVYLIPSLMASAGMAEGMSPQEPYSRMAIFADASMLVADPDRTKDATLGYDRIELSGDAWRRYCGFTDDDKPDALEVMARIWREQRRAVKETIRANEQDTGAGAPSMVLPDDPAYLPGADDPGANVLASAAMLDGLVDRVALAATVAAAGAVDQVCRVMRQRAKGRQAHGQLPPEWKTAVDMPEALLASHLPRSLVDELVPPDKRWAGYFAGMAATVEGLLREAGHPSPAESAAEVRRVAEAVAERRLFTPTWQVDRGDVVTAIALHGGERR